MVLAALRVVEQVQSAGHRLHQPKHQGRDRESDERGRRVESVQHANPVGCHGKPDDEAILPGLATDLTVFVTKFVLSSAGLKLCAG